MSIHGWTSRVTIWGLRETKRSVDTPQKLWSDIKCCWKQKKMEKFRKGPYPTMDE